jgi:hypothetical protein
MVAGYMALPWIGATYFAFGMPGVVHHHWNYHPSLAKSIYVVRDGRDVMVSTYFNVTKGYMFRKHDLSALSPISPARIAGFTVGRFAVLSRRLEHLFGRNFDPADVQRNLPRFIEAEMQKPFIAEARSPWPQHVRKWIDNSDALTCVKYEEMLADTRGAMADLLRDYLESEPVDADLDYVVKRFSFKRLTGRGRGEESRTSDARKGISGDWLNHFTTEARSVFNYHAGDLLVELGYEKDDQWLVVDSQTEAAKTVDQ